jgi:NAD(P)-dependent dehydrogenase (short-subunit alcohol dehydrogenase family)
MSRKIILVTGANRGVGFAIAQALATNITGSTVLLACRDLQKGHEAAERLKDLTMAASEIIPLALDVSSDTSIKAAAHFVSGTYGHLDALVNNAGYAEIPSKDDTSDWRKVYDKVLDVNVTSVALTTQNFLPLLRESPGGGQIINVSSARGSITNSASGKLPPSVSVAYCVSKAALNMLTVEMSRDLGNQNVEFQMVSPGHCKTAFNGFRGTRDPVEGANVVVELVKAGRGKYKNCGFWETRGASLELVEIPW